MRTEEMREQKAPKTNLKNDHKKKGGHNRPPFFYSLNAITLPEQA